MGTLLEAGSLAGDYLNGLLQAVSALAVVAALAYLVLRFLPGRLPFGQRNKRLEIEETLRIDGKSSLTIVRVEGRRLLVGSHSQAAVTLLTELDAPGVASGVERETAQVPSPTTPHADRP